MIIGGSGLNGQDSLPLEFGLGTESIADIRLWWPSGLVEDYSDIAANQHLTVIEGDGIHVGAESAELSTRSTEEGLLLSWQAEGIEPLAWQISRDGVTLVELFASSARNWLDINPPVGVNCEYQLTAVLSNGEERRLDSIVARWEAPLTSEMTLSAPWPCPATERVEVGFSLPRETSAQLSLYDISGRRLTSLSLAPEATSTTLDLTSYPAGVYLLRLSSELGSVEQRLGISREQCGALHHRADLRSENLKISTAPVPVGRYPFPPLPFGERVGVRSQHHYSDFFRVPMHFPPPWGDWGVGGNSTNFQTHVGRKLS